jgi:hypothetical protein
MKKLLMLGVSIAVFQLPGSAAPCNAGTLATYIALGSAGCVIGNLLVSDFDYRAEADGGAGKITMDQIGVTPLLAPVGSYALQFAALWSVETGQRQASHIRYQVHSLDKSIQVRQIRLNGSGFQAGLFGNEAVSEAFASAAITGSIEIYLKCTEVCRSETSTDVFSPPSNALVVQDAVKLDSKLGAGLPGMRVGTGAALTAAVSATGASVHGKATKRHTIMAPPSTTMVCPVM